MARKSRSKKSRKSYRRKSYRRTRVTRRRSTRKTGRVVHSKKKLAKRHGGAKWICIKGGRKFYSRTKRSAQKKCGK